MTVISVNDVSLSFGARELFKNISFSLETNDRLGIVGPNGCGKSTLLSLLLRENRPDEGSVFIAANTSVGILTQDSAYEVSADTGATALEQMYAAFPEHLRAEKRIAELERSGIICGYKSVIDWEKVDTDSVSAMIELKVTPKAGFGFEEVAARVAKYPEVESVYLMSGGYDLNVIVKGRTFHEVSNFVSRELAMIDSVTSTGTQFVMRRYKEYNVELIGDDVDGRSNISL